MIIAITFSKGGTGKTSTTLNLGAALVQKGKKVLLVDLDSQANLTTALGISPSLKESVGRLMMGEFEFPNVVQNKTGVDIIPSAHDLVVTEKEILNEIGSEYILKNILEPLKKSYDYILLDCPPSLGIFTVNALIASDFYINPMLAQTFSYDALNKTQQTVNKVQARLNPGLKLAGVLFTQHSANSRTILGQNIEKQVRSQVKVFNTTIRTNIAIVEAVHHKQHIFEYAPDSAGAVDYLSLSNEIMNLN